MRRRVRTVVLVLAASIAGAAEAKNVKVEASRGQVEAACDANGGFAWGTGASSGRYGCMTDNAWIECDANGNCEGGRALVRKPARTIPEKGSRRF